MGDSPQDRIVRVTAEIAQARARLVELDAERAIATRRLDELGGELAALQPTADQVVDHGEAVPRSNDQKIALFRSLFRGRSDVFPKYWRNQHTDRMGYSPACGNEWVRGVCDKPRVRCGECPQRAFLPVTDQEIRDHLRGRQVIGVYPLLQDDTCWFLALDFDKGDWQADVAALASTCLRLELPVAVERSRSGDGAHLWLFFAAAVPASSARQMGCCLLGEAMACRHELSMESYDRLFPNQDTVPRGGFGNLIALPLQHGPRQHDNTVFVDADWAPFPDQWAFLAGLLRLDPQRVAELARAAAGSGQIAGVRTADEINSAEVVAGLRLPVRNAVTGAEGALPRCLRVVLGQQLLVEKRGLPAPVISQIMRLAAFQNPEFYQKQRMRLSVAQTPRLICCSEDLPEQIGLPRGCLAELERLLAQYGVTIRTEDQRVVGEPLVLPFHGTLSDLQQKAAAALLAHDIGVFVAPPGTGKTVVGAYLVAARGRNTLVLVHRQQLLEQWCTQLSVFLDPEARAIGQIGGCRRKITGSLDVAMIQSLVRREKVDDLVAGYGHVIVDECHHVPAVSFERLMRGIPARYVTGLTATPQRRDGHHPILYFQLGPVRFTIDPKSEAARHPFAHRLIIRETGFHLQRAAQTPADAETPGAATTSATATTAAVVASPAIQEIYNQLAAADTRNELMIDDVLHALEEGRSPILLTERRAYVDALAARLRNFVRHLVILRGGMGRKQRREVVEQLARIPDDEERLILATGRFLGEGFDDARLDTLFLAMPVSWKGTLVQYAGRLQRSHRAKTEVRIYDYVDRDVPMLARMFEKRLQGYRAMGYDAERVADKGPKPAREYVLEYDDEPLQPK